MKQSIEVGAYGWCHTHWLDSFYPDDLPIGDSEDWRLSYYSNEFNAVMIPAHYWRKTSVEDCEEWLDAVHDDFRFIVEYDESIFDVMSVEEWVACLKILQPNLTGIVFSEGVLATKEKLSSLFDCAMLEITAMAAIANYKIWQQLNLSSCVVFSEGDLKDLRLARAEVDELVAQLNGKDITMIFNCSTLAVSDMSKFRSVLQIMGH